jgi:hypothetical protein
MQKWLRAICFNCIFVRLADANLRDRNAKMAQSVSKEILAKEVKPFPPVMALLGRSLDKRNGYQYINKARKTSH